MKAYEVTGTIDENGQLILDHPMEKVIMPSRVRVIILFNESTDELESDPDDTPVEDIKESLRKALKQVKTGQTNPISQLWDGIDGR